jgi:nucleoside-diphosphate-sugar epimerase
LRIVELESVRIVVVGGSGFLGGHLITALKARFGDQADFRVVGRRTTGPSTGQYVSGDRNDPALLKDLATWKPHLWYDLALFTPAEMDALLSHVAGLSGLQRIVVAGTIAEYGLHRPLPTPVSEDLPLDPEGTYGRNKAAAWEVGQARLADGLPLIWAVLPQLWGPGDPHGRDALYAHCLAHSQPLVLRGSGRTLMADGYVGTVAAALAHLGVATADYGRYNVCGATSTTPLQFIRNGAAALNQPAQVLHVEPRLLGELLRKAGRKFRPVFGDYDLTLDTTRLQQTGFRAPASTAEGIAVTVQWHAQNPTDIAPPFVVDEELLDLIRPHALARTYR